MDRTALIEQRKAKDEFFAHSHHSPLDHEARHDFQGLRYYEPSEDLVFELPVEPADGEEVTVQTSDGQVRHYRRAGVVNFNVAGQQARLTLYSTGQPGYFIPFRDATSGNGSYGAGRYLDIEPNADGTINLDFNEAYNPFCVYNEAYSCPLPPIENWLQVPIEAGEMDWPGSA